jgi:hypothetical protein
MLLVSALTIGPMLIGMGLIAAGAEKSTEAIEKDDEALKKEARTCTNLGLAFTLLAPLLNTLAYLRWKNVVATLASAASHIKHSIATAWDTVTTKAFTAAVFAAGGAVAIASRAFTWLTTGVVAQSAAFVWNTAMTIANSVAKAWNATVTAGLSAATWLWTGAMAAASGVLAILTTEVTLFMGITAPVWLILLAVAAAIAGIVILFKKWDEITKKLGGTFEKIFIKGRSPAFWEALKLSARYAAENVKQFKELDKVSARFGRAGIGAARGIPVGAGPGAGAVKVSMFEGARISLTKEAVPDFRNLVDKTVDKVFAKLERVFG